MSTARFRITTAVLCVLAISAFGQTGVLGPDPLETERTFSRSVLAQLRRGRFAELDDLSSSLRKTRATFDSGARKLGWFFDAFDVKGQAVQLGIRPADLEKLIDDWRGATASTTSRVALAQFHFSTAWQTDVADEEHVAAAARILESLDGEGKCDVECRFLQIEVHHLGGWSPPLRKILHDDPTYWHAFTVAGFYLTPQWGGSIDAIERFAVEAANATRTLMGDAMYMKSIVAAADSCGCVNHRFDWTHLRKGFEDFQALFPNSKINLNRFATFAFKAGDRETFRKLMAHPLFEPAQFPDSTRRWATEPEPRRAAQASSSPQVALTEMWTTEALEHPILFYFTAGERFFGVSVASSNISRWTLNGRMVTSTLRVPAEAAGPRSVVFEADSEPQLGAFPVRGADAVINERVAAIACRSIAGSCDPVRIDAKVSGTGTAGPLQLRAIEPPPFDQIVGAPVIDDRGALLGVVKQLAQDDEDLELTVEPVHSMMRMKRSLISLAK